MYARDADVSAVKMTAVAEGVVLRDLRNGFACGDQLLGGEFDLLLRYELMDGNADGGRDQLVQVVGVVAQMRGNGAAGQLFVNVGTNIACDRR